MLKQIRLLIVQAFMMKRLILLLCVLLSLGAVSAQDAISEKTFRLRQPTAEEYIDTIPEVLNQWKIDMQNIKVPPTAIIIVLSEETHTRFGDELYQIDSDTLYQIFELLSISDQFGTDRELWFHAILQSWLHHNQPDLATTDTFTIRDLEITVTPRDFNNDGQDEYLLKFNSATYSQFIVLQSTESGYEIVESPLPWYGCCFAYWSSLSGFMEEQYFGNMNDDGIPEWVLAEGGVGGGHMNHGQLYVLQWQDGKLVDISSDAEDWWDSEAMTYSASAGGGAPLFPWGVEVSFKDTDGDTNIDIVIEQEFEDSWNCTSYDTRIFSWDSNKGRYYLNDHIREFEDSAECNLRNAQDKIWDKDYFGAIPLLERAIDLYEQIEFDSDTTQYQVEQADAQSMYARVRLALAYIMTDDLDRAKTILSVDIPTYDNFQIITNYMEIAQQAIDTQPDKMSFCIALYNVFAEFYQNWESNPYWGATADITSPWGMVPNSQAPEGNPSNAGCDAMSYVDSIINSMSPTVSHPVDYLIDAELPIFDHIHNDLNHDGLDDWLVWLDIVDNNQMLFVSSPIGFQSKRLANITLPQPDQYHNWFEWELPNGLPALGMIYFDDKHTFDEIMLDYFLSGGGGPLGYCLTKDGNPNKELLAGNIVLLKLNEDSELDQIFRAYLCEPRTVEELFPDDVATQQLAVWRFDDLENDYYPIVPAIYVWNEEAGTYVYPETEDEQATETIQSNDESESQDVYLNAYGLTEAVNNGEYETAINLANDYLNASNEADNFSNDDTTTAYYYRAFSYEQLGMFDEALADYVTLYTATPDSAWGMLAGLHIEPTSES